MSIEPVKIRFGRFPERIDCVPRSYFGWFNVENDYPTEAKSIFHL